MMKKTKNIISIILIATMLSSCGKAPLERPELIEPASGNETYMPVERRNIGKFDFVCATVQPENYCHFWTTAVSIKSVNVEIGQYVKEGDILATADLEDIDDRAIDFQRQKDNYINLKAKEGERDDYMKQELQYRLQGAKEIGDLTTAQQTEKMLDELEENKHYAALLYDHRIARIDKELGKLSELQTDSTLVAKHSGYVTYALDIGVDCYAAKDKNIVVISDYDDRHLEYEAQMKNEYKIEYARFNNKDYELEVIPYSDVEKVIINRVLGEIPKRAKFANGEELPEVGTTVPIIRTKKGTMNVISVSTLSIYTDEEGSFVYIKNDNSDELEKRYIELGANDVNFYEVISGLSEGELVYTKTKNTIPDDYKEVALEIKDYDYTVNSTTLGIIDKDNVVKKFYGSGVVKSMPASGYKISKGEVICEITTDKGNAELLEMQTAMDKIDAQHKAIVEGLNAEIEGLKQQVILLETEKLLEEDSANKPSGNDTSNNKKEDSEDKRTDKKESEDKKTEENIPEVIDNNQVQVATKQDADREEITPDDGKENLTTEAEKETEKTTEDKKKEDNKTEIKKDDKLPKNEKEEEKKRPYLIDELKCEIEVKKANLSIENVNYVFQRASTESNFQRMNRDNDGSGMFVVRAEEDGVMSKVYAYEGEAVTPGQKLYAFGVDGNKKLYMKPSQGTMLTINANITIDINGEEKCETKVIGMNDNTSYVTTINDVVYITHNQPSINGAYFLESVDNDKVYSANDKKSLKCTLDSFKQIIVVPANCVHFEESAKNTYAYVWRLVDGNIIKQYVLAYKNDSAVDPNYCIFEGLNVGDVILDSVDTTSK